MSIWERNKVHGEAIEWGTETPYIMEVVAHWSELIVFAAIKDPENQFTDGQHITEAWENLKLDNILSIQWLEIFRKDPDKVPGYVEAGPPLYNKEKYNKRYLAKYMWFNCIKWCINQKNITYFDLGGGFRGSWLNLLEKRNSGGKFEKLRYKWLYVPKEVKNNFKLQPKHKVFTCTSSNGVDCNQKSIVTEPNEICPHCQGKSNWIDPDWYHKLEDKDKIPEASKPMDS